MTNYTNVSIDGGLGNLTSTIGSGATTLFGDPLVVGIIGMVIVVALGYTMKLDTDTKIMSTITMLFILIGSYLPEWVYWITLIPLGIYGGVVFSRIIHK